jgi:O-antigen/teichoic acid export membrane protein
MLFAVALTPALIHTLGPDRWGVFTLALSLVGMFGIFDFGIGRAITKNIAEAIGSGTVEQLASQIKTSLFVLFGFGIAGSLVMAACTEIWIRTSLKIPPALVSEARYSFLVLCLIVPWIVLGGGMWGILSAYQQSKAAMIISMPLTVMYYVGPLFVYRLTHSLVYVTALMVVLRLAATVFFWRKCRQSIPELTSAKVDFSTLGPVFALSGWMTISNVLWPVLAYVDRFTIASLVSTAAVGYYSTAGDLVTRLYLIPAAITGSIFPAIAAQNGKDPQKACELIRHGILTITSAIFPVSAVLLVFGTPLLKLWLGAEVASHISPLLPWFALGLILAASDTLITGAIDSLGHPKINSQFSIAELLLYVPFMAVCAKFAGLQGAAIAWALRAFFDVAVRLILLSRILPSIREHFLQIFFSPALAAFLGILCMLPNSVPAKLGVLLLSAMVYVWLLWSYPLSDQDRSKIQRLLMRPFARAC